MGNMRCSKCDKYHDECNCEMTELRDECDNWRQAAVQFCSNAEYYAGLVDQIAKFLGPGVFVSDDGSIQDSPLRAKVPEMVGILAAENDRLRGLLGTAHRGLTDVIDNGMGQSVELDRLRRLDKLAREWLRVERDWLNSDMGTTQDRTLSQAAVIAREAYRAATEEK